MSDRDIRASFNLGDDAYAQLEKALEARMEALNLFDTNIEAVMYKRSLHEAIDQIRNAFPNAFHELNGMDPEEIRKLTLMSQMLHRRRRQTEALSMYSPSVRPRMQASPGSRDPLPFHATTIIAERDDPERAFVVCRPKDLVGEKELTTTVTIDDVRFDLFMALLENDDDVCFDQRLDRIVHTFVGGRAKNVSGELVWRVALQEMHAKGSSPLIFTIRRVAS